MEKLTPKFVLALFGGRDFFHLYKCKLTFFACIAKRSTYLGSKKINCILRLAA